MQYQINHIYHIYNRGNNRQKLFFTRDNYLFFLGKIRRLLLPHCDIISYCLMPNHFHFQMRTNENSLMTIRIKEEERNVISEALRNILSTYSLAINKQERRTGSLFTQNTKVKDLTPAPVDWVYPVTCFHYIHQNPYVASLVTKMEDWEFSSFRDYTQLRNGTLCNQMLVKEVLKIDFDNFYEESYKSINPDKILKIW
jgi:putative transposase